MESIENGQALAANIVKVEHISSDDNESDIEMVHSNEIISDVRQTDYRPHNRMNGFLGQNGREPLPYLPPQNGRNGMSNLISPEAAPAQNSPQFDEGMTFKMTDNLLTFIRAVTNGQALNSVLHAIQQQRVTPPDSPKSVHDENQAQIRSVLSEEEQREVAKFMNNNPKCVEDDVSLLFSAKFKKNITKTLLNAIKFNAETEVENISKVFQKPIPTFPEIDERIARLLDVADINKRTKTLDQGRKIGRTVDHLQKRKPFIRLSFGEKHIIAKYIKEFPNKTYPEYAKYFSELWDRTVTARQIITTKENMDKWLNEAYKDCQQTHYKFVDEGSNHNGPMVMKRKRSRVMLTPEEREEISNFLADNSEMTFNQIAEIFAARWSKDVNRTHVASIMRLREKHLEPANSKKAKNMTLNYNKYDPEHMNDFNNHLHLPENTRTMIQNPVTSSANNMPPMSGLDLLKLVDEDAKNRNKNHSNRPITSMLQNNSSPNFGRVQCEKCGGAFENQSALITHILTSPDHLNPEILKDPSANSSFGSNMSGSPNFNSKFNHGQAMNRGLFDIKPEYNH